MNEQHSPIISAIICTCDRYEFLVNAINSIEEQNLDYDTFELIIVDNTPPGEKRDAFVNNITINCNAQYICEDISGLSRARNLGLEYAKGKYIAYLDDDAKADPEWLGSLIKRFATSIKIGVVGGPVKPIWPVERPSWLHEWQEGYLTIIDRGPVARELNRGEWLAGTNIAFVCETLRKVGGFNPGIGRVGRNLLSNEELEVSKLIVKDGYAIYYEPNAIIYHRVHADRLSQEWFRRRVSWQAVSDILTNSQTSVHTTNIEIILDFLSVLPLRDRHISSLFKYMKEKDKFQKQLSAVEALTILLLDGSTVWPKIERK